MQFAALGPHKRARSAAMPEESANNSNCQFPIVSMAQEKVPLAAGRPKGIHSSSVIEFQLAAAPDPLSTSRPSITPPTQLLPQLGRISLLLASRLP